MESGPQPAPHALAGVLTAPHPPLTAGAPTFQRPPVWPTALGVVLIVFGGGGILVCMMGVLSLVFPDIGRFYVSGSPAVDMDAIFEAVRPSQVRYGIISALGIPVAALLLAVGVGTTRRLAWALPGAFLWAALKIAMSVALGLTVFSMQQAQFEAISRTTRPTGLPASFGLMMGVFGLVVTLLWGSALPTFLAVWFSRRSIREQVAGWAPARRSPGPPLHAPD